MNVKELHSSIIMSVLDVMVMAYVPELGGRITKDSRVISLIKLHVCIVYIKRNYCKCINFRALS